MKADEKRLLQLAEDPNDDDLREEDIPLIRKGILHLNWTDTPSGRIHPFVTVSLQAVRYLQKEGRLTPAHRRVLKDIGLATNKDIEWAKAQTQTKY
tara:strand:+ start:2566 stop:2853 length:288 start_codon:yes stop_codon:yes gene_type:complete